MASQELCVYDSSVKTAYFTVPFITTVLGCATHQTSYSDETTPLAAPQKLEPSFENESEARKDIKQVYLEYIAAMRASDASKCVDFLSAKSLRYVGTTQANAIHLSAEDTKKQPLVQKLLILQLRLEVPVEDLATQGQEDMASYILPWLWELNDPNQKYEEVARIEQDKKQIAKIYLAPHLDTPRFVFTKAPFRWTLDIEKSMQILTKRLQQKLHESNLTEDEFIFQMLKARFNRNLTEELWEPLVKQP